jgi:protein involved in sex pheromone biosynthesis
MKKLLTFALLSAIVIFSACGNAKNDEEAEKKKQDSIEQAKADSIAEAEAKEKAKQDSIAEAEAKAQQNAGNNNTPKDKVNPAEKPVEEMTEQEQKEVIKNSRG